MILFFLILTLLALLVATEDKPQTISEGPRPVHSRRRAMLPAISSRLASLRGSRVRCALAPLAIVLFAQTGCVSSGYKLARKNGPPPAPLNLTPAPAADPAPAKPEPEITLDHVIYFQGPGSWKRDAYWDEYVLTLANHGTTTITVDSATLTDFQGVGTAPGVNPWELEKQSRSYEAAVRATAGFAQSNPSTGVQRAPASGCKSPST